MASRAINAQAQARADRLARVYNDKFNAIGTNKPRFLSSGASVPRWARRQEPFPEHAGGFLELGTAHHPERRG